MSRSQSISTLPVAGTFSRMAACYGIVDSQDRIVEASAALAHLLLFEDGSLVDTSLADLVHPEDTGKVAEYLLSARTSSQAVAGSVRLRRRTGDHLTTEVSLVPTLAGDGSTASIILHVALPVSPGRASSFDGEAHYGSVVSALAQGIIVQDPSGAVIDCNAAAERILGRDASDLMNAGSSVRGWGAIDEDGRPLAMAEYPPAEALSSRKRVSHPLAIRKPDGHLAWISVTSVPLHEDGESEPRRVVSTLWDMTELREKERQLEHDSRHDALTDLPDRQEFFGLARRAFGDSGRTAAVRDAVLFLDLDDFKRVNDMFGHSVGDELLAQAALRLRQCIRPGDVAARLAGDEFALLLLDVGSVWNAVRVAERVLESFSTPFPLAGLALDVATSIGISVAAESVRDPDSVISQADIALRRAKAAGKGRYVVYDAHLDARVRENLEIESDLRQALAREEFEVHFQPVVESCTGAVAGAEALLRWRHPKRGMISPAEFIPVAEDNGTIHPIGEWVLEESLTQLKSWLETYPNFYLGINLSPKQLESPQFLTTFARILGVSGVPHDSVMLELTETYLMQDVERAARDLRRFAGLGVQIAIDDFGTGYSSLKYLQHLPITHLKIDRSFIHRVVRDERSRVLIEAIQLLADKLDLKVIAEGVETRAQADFLLATGCRWAQGFLYEKPMPEARFGEYLLDRSTDRGAGF